MLVSRLLAVVCAAPMVAACSGGGVSGPAAQAGRPAVDWNGIALAALPYGSTLLVDTFRCDSATTGATFQNQSTGHGFFMSRESCRIFSWMTTARPLDTACLVPCVP
jgi:hypothetical protein